MFNLNFERPASDRLASEDEEVLLPASPLSPETEWGNSSHDGRFSRLTKLGSSKIKCLLLCITGLLICGGALVHLMVPDLVRSITSGKEPSQESGSRLGMNMDDILRSPPTNRFRGNFVP